MTNSKNFNYLILFLFIGLWSSIGSDPYNFLFIFEKEDNLYSIISKMNFKNLINFFRSLFPLFCLAVCLVIILKYKLFKKQKKFIYILLLIQIIQIIKNFYSKNTIMSNFENSINHIGRYHWIISSIASLLLFMIANKLKNFDMKKLFYVSIFFLIIMFLFFSAINLYDFYFTNIKSSLYNLDVYRESAYFLDHAMPRVTGISRTIIFLYVIFFFININLKQNYKFLIYGILIFLGSFIFLYQSKYALASYILINILFYFNSKNKINVSKIILVLFISQLVLFFTISNSRIISSGKITIKNFDDTVEKEHIIDIQKKINHLRKFNNPSLKGIDHADHIVLSGRATLWIMSLEYIKLRPFMGYGSMSDRTIINQERITKKILVNPISNAFLYALFSGGIFSLFLLIYFWLSIKEKMFSIFSFQDISNNEKKIGVTIICLIGLRCLIENSVMLFGVDYLLLLNSLYLTEKK